VVCAAVAGVGQLWRSVAVVTWSGARGVVPLAAVLAVPASIHDGLPFPDRPQVLAVATAVVVVSVVVQGLTLKPLVRRLGVASVVALDDGQAQGDAVGDDVLPGGGAGVEAGGE
jgi:NhaP-type Na+/H+ or K+/H+ antiporter